MSEREREREGEGVSVRGKMFLQKISLIQASFYHVLSMPATNMVKGPSCQAHCVTCFNETLNLLLTPSSTSQQKRLRAKSSSKVWCGVWLANEYVKPGEIMLYFRLKYPLHDTKVIHNVLPH